jgi:tripartite-type tricarboxylate transporter receptor subunit TctC
MKRNAVRGAVIGCLALLAAALPARAGSYPERVVRLVVNSAAGSVPDIIARLMGPKLSEQFGQPVVIENKGGANGSLAAGEVARAAPDGYTVLVATAGTLTANPHLYPQSAAADVLELTPVTQVATFDFIVAARSTLPVKTMKDLIDLIRANPGKLTAATTAHGSFPHLALEMLRQRRKLDFVIVKHIGGAAAGTAVAGEHADFVIETAAVLEPFITAGRLVPLASTNAGRSPQSPDLPTVAESGIEGFAISGWIGVAAPEGTPLAIREAIQRAIAKALADESIRDRVSNLHFSIVASPPQEFERVITRERAQVGETIRSGGLAEK